mgnify:CR=1 FL=1
MTVRVATDDDWPRILDVHRRGEARANLAFSARQVRAHLARHAVGASATMWRACAFALSGMERAYV